MNETRPDVARPRRLWLTIIGAAAAGTVLLVAVVLPIEYGIDPLSTGRLFGVEQEPQAMNSPSDASGQAAPEEQEPPADDLEAIMMGNTVNANPATHSSYSRSFRSEEAIIEIAPFQEVEYKAQMSPGDVLLYTWETDKPVYADTHGEPHDYPDSPAVRYLEEDGVKSAHGRISPPVDGIHGWYWLNTNESPITIRLEVSGWYENLEEEYRSAE